MPNVSFGGRRFLSTLTSGNMALNLPMRFLEIITSTKSFEPSSFTSTLEMSAFLLSHLYQGKSMVMVITHTQLHFTFLESHLRRPLHPPFFFCKNRLAKFYMMHFIHRRTECLTKQCSPSISRQACISDFLTNQARKLRHKVNQCKTICHSFDFQRPNSVSKSA